MRVEFIVTPSDDGTWVVRRGHTSPLEFTSHAAAMQAAENLAQAATRGGDRAFVTLKMGDEIVEQLAFQPG
jgi:hypothetical protein